jgi:hypothetical protein
VSENTHGRDPKGSGSHLSGEADKSSSSLRDIDPSRKYGIPNEAPDDAMEIVGLIEDAMMLTFAPNGDANFTWRSGQDIGLIIDRALDDAFTKGFYAGIGRKPPSQGIEAEGRDAQRLGASHESPVAEGHAPNQSHKQEDVA